MRVEFVGGPISGRKKVCPDGYDTIVIPELEPLSVPLFDDGADMMEISFKGHLYRRGPKLEYVSPRKAGGADSVYYTVVQFLYAGPTT